MRFKFKDSRVTKTYDQIQRIRGREAVRRVHRLGHAVVAEISLAMKKRQNLNKEKKKHVRMLLNMGVQVHPLQ